MKNDTPRSLAAAIATAALGLADATCPSSFTCCLTEFSSPQYVCAQLSKYGSVRTRRNLLLLGVVVVDGIVLKLLLSGFSHSFT
jgi:Kef-type K+ transport system membrane component KefB